MPLQNPLTLSTYMNKGVLIGIGGSWLVAVMYWGPFQTLHMKESGYDPSKKPDNKQAALVQEITTWAVQSMAMYYLVKQMEIDDPVKATLAVGGVVGVLFSALPHYMRWKWVEEKSNKSLTAIMIDCGGLALFNMVQAYCVAKYG